MKEVKQGNKGWECREVRQGYNEKGNAEPKLSVLSNTKIWRRGF
jgi:hypothetical protein